MDTFTLSSSVFADWEMIPMRFTCEGENTNPPLIIEGTPEGTMSLAVIVDDPDIPAEVKQEMGIEVYDHWVAYNIPPSTSEISEGDTIGTQGANSSGGLGYTGPCPPAKYEPTEHRYMFTVYALDTTLDLPEDATKQELKAAMQGHVIASAELMGRYEMQDA